MWDDWVIGDCSVTCGVGSSNNTRTHKVSAQFGGDDCNGSTSAIENCKQKECPGRICSKQFPILYDILTTGRLITLSSLIISPIINFAVHCVWNVWKIGDCSVTCGEGTRVNTRTQNVTAQFGGNECDGSTSAIENCKDQECPGKKYPKQLST